MKRNTFSSLTKINVLWLLDQFQGLSHAIRNIHYLENPETGTNLLAPRQGPRQSGWHHDLKPENMLYFKEINPKGGSFKIADFLDRAKCIPIDQERDLTTQDRPMVHLLMNLRKLRRKEEHPDHTTCGRWAAYSLRC